MKLPKRKLIRIPLYLLSALIILLAIDLTWIRLDRIITPGPDTTRLTSPLKPDGLPDYVQFLDSHASAGVTNENNAAVLLQQGAGPSIFHTFEFAIQPVYTRLGLTPPPPNDTTQYFKMYEEYLIWVPADSPTPTPDLYKACTRPWTAAENPLLARCLQENAHAFDLLHQATQRPRYFFPMVNSPGHEEAVSLLILQLGPNDRLARSAAARAMLRIASGDFDGAHADLLDVHKLARLLAQSPTLVEFSVALSLDQLASQGEQTLARTEKLSAAQAKQFLADLQSLPPMPPLANAIDNGERMLGLDTITFAARIGLPTAFDLIASPGTVSFSNQLASHFIPVNFNDAMRLSNHFYDGFTAATNLPTFAQRRAALTALEAEAPPLAQSLDPAKRFLSLLIPSFVRISSNQDLAAAHLTLAKLSLALAAFHADHQSYPHSLSDLAPQYLPTIPLDPFTNQPLTYTLSSSSYTLTCTSTNLTPITLTSPPPTK